MRGEESVHLIEVNSRPRPLPDEPPAARRLLAFLVPVIVTGTVTAALAAGAALAGFQRDTMLLVAAGAGLLVSVPILLVVYREVADRRAAVRALENVEARVGGIVESAMDAIVTIDEEQRVVQFNASAERVFRWPRTAVIGQKVSVLLPERYRDAHARHVGGFGASGVSSRGMGRQSVLAGLRADGAEFPVEASISQHIEDGRKFFTVILRDVTERVRNAILLQESESRMRGILESAMDAIITVDESQHVVLFNKAAEEVFGCPRDEAIGAPLDWFIPERFRAGHRKLVQDFGASAETARRMGHARVVQGRRRNGEEFPIEASISHITENGRRYFTVILRDVSARVAAEQALRSSGEQIQQLALAASTAREQEKARIARELHDELGQGLTALKIDVGWLRGHVGEPSAEVAAKLASMQGLLDATVAAARRISADLRPLMLDDLGLTAAAEWMVQNFATRTGIKCDLALGKGELDLPDPYATTVFRTLQECLTNAAKHAEATHVDVSLYREDGDVLLEVSDDGRGFETQAQARPGSFGLIGLRERAYLVGGDLSIDSVPGRGTRVQLRVPVKAAG
jgi:hypothetical protein